MKEYNTIHHRSSVMRFRLVESGFGSKSQENAASNWDDIVFIPPGFEVSTEQTHE